MKCYKVLITVQNPDYTQRNGISFYVNAVSKADAIKAARRLNASGGQVHSQHGRAIWKAIEVEYE